MPKKKEEEEFIEEDEEPMLNEEDLDELDLIIEEHPPKELDYPISPLERLKLNLMEKFGDPMRVKYDLVERNIAILNGIEQNPEALQDPDFLRIYVGASRVIFGELDKLDDKWDRLSSKRVTQDQLQAFANIELFIDFITEQFDDSEFVIRAFIEFLQDKGMFKDQL